jgi:hypothetical protein
VRRAIEDAIDLARFDPALSGLLDGIVALQEAVNQVFARSCQIEQTSAPRRRTVQGGASRPPRPTPP